MGSTRGRRCPWLLLAAGVIAVATGAPWAVAADDAGIRLAILQPKPGDGTTGDVNLRVQALGGSGSITVRFTVAVDGHPIDASGHVLDEGSGAAFSVPVGLITNIGIHGLPIGTKLVTLEPVSPAGLASASVRFTVGPGPNPKRGPLSIPFVIVVLVLGLLLFLSRRRIAEYSRRFDPQEESNEADDDDGEPRGRRDGWGEP